METFKAKLASRKLWAAMLGSLAPVLLAYLGQDIPMSEAITLSAGILCSYILGQAGVDAMAQKQLSD